MGSIEIKYENKTEVYSLEPLPLAPSGGESGVPIEVSELPIPTAEDVGKVYFNQADENYYVGEESKVGWAQYEDLGNKIYFDTSVNLTEIVKEYAPINEPVTFFRISDASGLSQEDFLVLTIMDLSMMGMSGHIYVLSIPEITDAYVYIDCDTLTVEQLNETFGQMGMPTSFAKFGWQMDELDTSEWASRGVDQVGGWYEREINGEWVDFYYGENFAYKEKGYTLQKLVKATE